MVSTVMGSMAYLGSGASFHMTGNEELFSSLEEKDLQMHVEMGDDETYRTTGIGIDTFQRDSGKPLILKDVMHVPGLKMNLVSIAMLEDLGYDVVFSEGKVFLCHKAIGQVKNIGVHVKNLYKLDVDDCATLNSKAKKVESRDISGLWHRRLGHIHHNDFRIMQHIYTRLPKGTLA